MEHETEILEIILGTGKMIGELDFDKNVFEYQFENGKSTIVSIHWFMSEMKKAFLHYGDGYSIRSYLDYGSTAFASTFLGFKQTFSNAHSEAEAVMKICGKIITYEDSL